MMHAWSGPRARRIDVDLLRAVAVLAVILFHFDVPGFDGGFLGVDIFFVISGYLISLHIQQQLARGRFSFPGFYLRRIRRLFPALMATLFGSSVAAVFILPRSLLEDFSHSQIASAVYVSNIYFWSVADYFDTASILKPLLHTWSLSVEEQFYLVWPLFLVLTFRRWPRLSIAFAGLVSLAAAEWMQSVSASTAFYLFPFRVFEFALGAVICGVTLEHWPRRLRNGALVASVAAILLSITLIDEQSRNPGLVTVPLCAATALVIALRHSWANRAHPLSLVFLRIGLVSYSAYLVHWPLVVFYKIGHPGPLAGPTAAVMLVVTYLLAEASYLGVERPTARIDLQRRRKWLYASLPGVLILALAVDIAWPRVYGALHRSNVSVVDVLDRIQPYSEVREQANDAIRRRHPAKVPANRTRILVIGDSHAIDVHRALLLVLPLERYDINVMFSLCDPLAAASIDIPLTELYRTHGQKRTHNPEYCRDYHAEFIDKLAAREPNVVVFSEAWRRDTLPFIADTLSRIRARVPVGIVLLGRNMQWSAPPEVAFRRIGRVEDLNAKAWELRNPHYENFDSRLGAIAEGAGVAFISKRELVCPAQHCTVLVDGEFTYADEQHWTMTGLRYYGRSLVERPVFSRLLEVSPSRLSSTKR